MKVWATAFILMLITAGSSHAIPPRFVEKTITVKVNADEDCFIDGIKIFMYDLPQELNKRLWRSFVGNDRMPDNIAVVYEGEVSESTKKSTLAAVKEAQRRTLIQYCIYKYKKKFEDLNTPKQNKVKSRFPVLFQTEFSTP